MLSSLFLFLLVAALKTNHIYCEIVNITIFNAINTYRDLYDVPLLADSYELFKDATRYAQHLATLNIKDQILFQDTIKGRGKKTITIDHMDYPPSDPKNKDYTEMIGEFTKPIHPIAYWYVRGGECYQQEERSKVEQSLADKYTAMFWKSSKKVGVGIAPKDKDNDKGRWIMVVRFTPPGNQPGEYEENLPAKPSLDDIFSSGRRQEPVLWIYIVLSIQIICSLTG